MYPGSFIWKRISDKWLLRRSVALAFAASSAVILGMTVAIVTDTTPIVGSVFGICLGIGGVLAAIAVFFLWGGMWRYWQTFDSSSVAMRRTWLLVLIFGVWYGAIIYYLFIYLPDLMRLNRTQQRSR